jgi:hypothetical protein
MSGNGGGVDGRHLGERPEQRVCQQRQDQGQQNARDQGGREPQIDAMGRHTRSALEADGEQQIERHALGDGFGKAQIGPRHRGRDTEHEAENDRRDQVLSGRRQNSGHPRPLPRLSSTDRRRRQLDSASPEFSRTAKPLKSQGERSFSRNCAAIPPRWRYSWI